MNSEQNCNDSLGGQYYAGTTGNIQPFKTI